MSAWQPIETAPKDGTRVLIYAFDVGDHEIATAEWCDRWIVSPLVSDDWGLMDFNFEPTHWMPLPEPPNGP